MLLLFDEQYSQVTCGFENKTTRLIVIANSRVFGLVLSRELLADE